jgi:four helix bundle protein
MSRPKSYRELIAWQKAMALARQVYLLTASMPKREVYGLVSQIRRAAVAIPSNIAEGYGRVTDTQFRHFLGNARGSLCELQTQLELAADLGYMSREAEHQLTEQGTEVARLINGFLSSLKHANPANRTNPANPTSTANPANPANTTNTANPANTAKSHVS